MEFENFRLNLRAFTEILKTLKKGGNQEQENVRERNGSKMKKLYSEITYAYRIADAISILLYLEIQINMKSL